MFKCWYCKESGGVLRFIALLEGKSEQELIEELRQSHGWTREKHPAERLTKRQLSMIGYPHIDWNANHEFDKSFAYEFRQRIWQEWQYFVKEKKQFCYRLLFVGLITGNLERSIKDVEKVEKEIGVKFKDELLDQLFQESKDYEVFQMEKIACELAGIKHPYETIEIDNEKVEKMKMIGVDLKMLNVCTFVGRLATEVELRYTPNGHAVCTFNLALTRPVPDQNGERKADFIRCQAWGKVAENMANNLSKGDVIGFQSRVQTRSYENQQGQTVYVTEFIVEGIPQYIKVKKWESNGKNGSEAKKNPQPQPNYPYGDPFFEDQPTDISDDLPF